MENPTLNERDNRVIKIFKGYTLAWFAHIIILIFLILGLSFFDFDGEPTSSQLLSILIIIVPFLLFSWNMHFFALSKDCFIVKNDIFFWMKNTYRLKDIKVVIFIGRSYKYPNYLKIITKDNRSNLYPSSSLGDSTWLEIKEELKKKRVRVKDDRLY
jgi:hypothetical protein